MGRNKIAAQSPRPDSVEATHPQGPSRDLRRLLPGIAISLLSLAVVFYFADLERIAAALQLADWSLVALGLLLTLSWLGARSFVWRTLLLEKPTLSQTFLTINEGYLLNNLLPFRLGELGRAFLLARKAGLDFWHVFSTVLIERTLDLAFAAGLLLVTLPFVVGASWARGAAPVAGVIVLLGLLALHLLARYREAALAFYERLAARVPLLSKVGSSRLPAFLDGLESLTDAARFLRAAGWMSLNWVLALLQYYVLLRAFFPQAQLLWAAFALGVAALGIAAPSSPGAMGVYELAIVGALSVFNQDASTALTFAFTAHLTNYVTTGLLGAYGLAQDGETLSGVYRRIRSIRKVDER